MASKNNNDNGQKLSRFPIHLGLGATAVQEPEFNGMEWYSAYGERHSGDGFEGRLVSMHTFDKSWDMWEMHPNGSEVVVCTEGMMKLIQEFKDGTVRSVILHKGESAINEPGVWHTADIDDPKQPATALFITAGVGTQHRPRE